MKGSYMNKTSRYPSIWYLMVISLFLLSSIGCVTEGGLSRKAQSSPENVVRQYLATDLRGAKLSTESIQKSVLPKIIIPTEYVSPGWDTVVIVMEPEILSVTPAIGREDEIMMVGVRYRIVGEAFGEEVINKSAVEDYTFEVRRVDNRWFIMDPTDLCPHISQAGLIHHLEGSYGNWKLQIEKVKSLTGTLQTSPLQR
jgi:hypothetical protein